VLCEQRLNRSASPFDQELHRTGEVTLRPALGMLVAGYFLLVTRRHAPSFAHLEAGDWLRVESDVTRLLRGLGQVFGEYLILEHGSCSTRPSGSCIDHAHLHLVPLAGQLRNALLDASEVEWKRCDGFKDVSSRRATGYVSLRIGEERWISDSDVPSQWLRRVIGRQLGTDAWDWAVDSGAENLQQTMLALSRVRDQSLARTGATSL
jgi:diadenosine tetraphosphate (Ap4A) HIT family hydrolase